ncbi:hypothetical protein, partial [Paraburkholderia sp. EG304]|uniref:hypothetical protein n=1 Tax=Paraburkholderia sp. EG304 TaxID=3237015 RepID=UPI00397D5F59
MIADPDRYEPRAGDTVLDFARHYGTSFLPARVYRPQDKESASHCTLSGSLSGYKGWLCCVASACAPHKHDVAEGFVQAP